MLWSQYDRGDAPPRQCGIHVHVAQHPCAARANARIPLTHAMDREGEAGKEGGRACAARIGSPARPSASVCTHTTSAHSTPAVNMRESREARQNLRHIPARGAGRCTPPLYPCHHQRGDVRTWYPHPVLGFTESPERQAMRTGGTMQHSWTFHGPRQCRRATSTRRGRMATGASVMSAWGRRSRGSRPTQ